MRRQQDLRQSVTELLAVLTREERHPVLRIQLQAALDSGSPTLMLRALEEFDKLSTVEIMMIRLGPAASNATRAPTPSRP